MSVPSSSPTVASPSETATPLHTPTPLPTSPPFATVAPLPSHTPGAPTTPEVRCSLSVREASGRMTLHLAAAQGRAPLRMALYHIDLLGRRNAVEQVVRSGRLDGRGRKAISLRPRKGRGYRARFSLDNRNCTTRPKILFPLK